MKIGILQCGRVKEELQADYGDYPQMFIQLFKQVSGQIEFNIYPVLDGVFPESTNECDAWLTTGSRSNITENLPWMQRLLSFIHELDEEKRKFVGICFGHQALAIAMGGTVDYSRNGWGVGVHCNNMLVSKPWMVPGMEKINIIVTHEQEVVSLPHEAELLASNDHCTHSIFQLGEHLLGIQGHPEFSKEYSRALMEDRRELFPADRLSEGLSSLSQDVHGIEMIQWITRFIQGR